MVDSDPLVSVIIPTHNRKDSLRRTLDGLASQTYPRDRFEVIVVDDASSDGTGEWIAEAAPMPVRYLCQEHRGATEARNNGAIHSTGVILVFFDDDIVPHRTALEHAIKAVLGSEHAVILGSLGLPPSILSSSVYARVQARLLDENALCNGLREVPFQHCMTGFLAIRRDDYCSLGMFRDPTGGWPNWDDVDFGYRASLAGYRILRSLQARAEHWDYAAAEFEAACTRWYRAAQAGAILLRRHPDLVNRISMFHDKGPIAWRKDSLGLVARKVVRSAVSAPPVQAIVRWLARLYERRWPDAQLLEHLYNWQVSAHIRRGYQMALSELDDIS